ncbi:hypothetical protein KKP97_02790 [Methanothermococcus sp. SCGC AD-155-C09]|nr:hypothetical protein [Methanothermococcus sp. SCGC AD-155-C09]
MKYNWKLAIVGILLLIAMLPAVFANPLKVFYVEAYNVTANVSGDGTTEYAINNLTGYIKIENSAQNDTLSDVWVAINISNNISAPTVINNTTPRNISIENSVPTYTGLPSNLTYVHIPILPNNKYVKVAIQLNTSNVGVPILINESYSATKIPANRFATWNVSLNISRNVSALPNPYTKVSIRLFKHLSNKSYRYGNSTWTFLNISNVSANQGTTTLYNGPYFTGTANDSIEWYVELNSTHNGSLSFTITANNSYTGRGATKVNYGFAAVNFYYRGTTGATVVEGVYAIGDGGVSVCKKGPELDSTTGEYTLWYENTSFKNEGNNYYYNIIEVNIWAVNGSNPTNLDPFNPSLLISGSNHTETPTGTSGILAPGEIWTSQNYNFTFNGKVPVIWANYTFRIVDNNISLNSYSYDEDHKVYGSSYIIVEKIYVVGSYLIKVTKTVKTNPDGTYNISIVVENIGGEESPLVYVYDLIPNNFTIVGNYTVNKSEMLIENQSGNYSLPNNSRYNLSMYWCLKPLNGGADGDGWYTPTELNNSRAVLITYTLSGTGNYTPSDLFIVGIDPTHSLLPTTSPKTILVGGSDGKNFEILLALLTGIIGMGIIVRRLKN